MKRLLLAVLTGALMFYPGAVHTSAQSNALNFFKNYFITGDYVVGGTSLWRKGVNGRATEQIDVSGMPPGVDVVAAYLYVQTAEAVQWSGIEHAIFNGQDLGPGANSIAKALNYEQATRPCWSVAWPGGRRIVTYRADVLRFLPLGSDGKYAVNGSHTIEVPDFGYAFPDLDELGEENSNETGARAIGASLVVVYRDPAAPFRGVVIYDGGFTKHAFSTMSLMLSGFYQASATPGAKMTHLVGDGRPYLSERVRLNGNLIATNPYVSAAGSKWDNPTFTDLPVIPGSGAAALEVTPNGLFSDCVSASAVVFSTEVQDTDDDGLLDLWEASDTTLLDPNGRPLPNLKAMGANPFDKDLFIEVGYMYRAADTAYGGVLKPAHAHLPPPDALKLVGDAFKNAPTGRINVHFDVGEAYPSGPADPYVIRGAGLARGGEAIDELVTACQPGPTDAPYVCQFADFPGTVGWKSGFRFLRDEVLSVTPPANVPPPPVIDDTFCDTPGYTCERRFDASRSAMFRYALFAHALGLPKSELACLDSAGAPVADVDDACAVAPNPEFHAPRTNTGIGDFPGADLLVTLGAFDDVDGLPVGTPFMQASTLMHELGHNFERRHGGEAFEPNCKPTYLSVMNYLYQLRGLLDDAGTPHLDFSPRVEATIDETNLVDAPLLGLTFRLGWYAPLAGSYLTGQGRAATRHCDGSPLLTDTAGVPSEVPMVRIDARTAADDLDWNANGALEPGSVLDINFNGRLDGPPLAALAGSDDWSNLRLNQIGSRRNVGGLYVYATDASGNPTSLAVGPLSVDSGKGDLGKGDLGKGDLGKGDLGKGDLGKGDLGKGDLGKGDLGKGDLGKGDLGGGDLFLGDPNNPSGELDFETATSLGKTPPNEFTACVIGVDCAGSGAPLHDVTLEWKAPTVGGVSAYSVYRVPGATLLPGQTWTLVGTVDPTVLSGVAVYSLIDATDLVNGALYTYFAVANYTDGTLSDPSNLVTITAVNDPPSAGDDSYSLDEDTVLVQPAPGLLTNDTDDGSRPLTATLVAPAAHGTVVLAADGSFTYTPQPNYHGPDAFTYTATDGEVASAVARVTLMVNPVNDAPVAVGESYTMNQGATLTVAVPGVLANDFDVDSAPLTAVLVAGPANATLTLNPDGSFTLTPVASFSGSTSFTYKASDGTATSNTVTVSITVNPVGYGFLNVKNLPPAPGVTFKPSSKGTLVDFEWKFTSNGGVVASADALPSVTITGPYGYNQTFTPANCGSFGFTFVYKSSSKLWDFHWSPRNAAVGTYYVVVRSGKTGQSFPATGGFPVVFKR